MRRTLQDQVKPHLELLLIDASPCGTGGGGRLEDDVSQLLFLRQSPFSHG